MDNILNKIIGKKSKNEYIGVHYKSEIIDTIYYRDGTTEIVNQGHNVMLNTFLPLLTDLLVSGEANRNIKYWAIGSGESSWDTSMPTPLPTQTKLVNEVYRKAISSSESFPTDGIYFIDPSTQQRVTTPSNVIEVQITFGENEGLVGGEDTPWREFGIVGGSNATSTLESGKFVNAKNHAVITKTDSMIIERKIRFTFTNADTN